MPTLIITGASAGIGAATAIEAAKAGYDILLNARREEKLQRVAEAVRAHGRRTAIVAADVADPGVNQRLLDVAESELDGFDAVYANAGYGVDRAIVATSDADLRRIFEVNFFAGVDLLREAARRMVRAERRGRLFMCSSCIAKFTIPWHGPYCATKAAQSHICRAMRHELARAGIQVFSVHPIGTKTEFFEVSDELSGRDDGLDRSAGGPFMQPPERVARAIVRNLKRRKAKPEVWTSRAIPLWATACTLAPTWTDPILRKLGHTPQRPPIRAEIERFLPFDDSTA